MDYVIEKFKFKGFFLKPTDFKKLYFFSSFKSKVGTHSSILSSGIKILSFPE